MSRSGTKIIIDGVKKYSTIENLIIQSLKATENKMYKSHIIMAIVERLYGGTNVDYAYGKGKGSYDKINKIILAMIEDKILKPWLSGEPLELSPRMDESLMQPMVDRAGSIHKDTLDAMAYAHGVSAKETICPDCGGNGTIPCPYEGKKCGDVHASSCPHNAKSCRVPCGKCNGLGRYKVAIPQNDGFITNEIDYSKLEMSIIGRFKNQQLNIQEMPKPKLRRECPDCEGNGEINICADCGGDCYEGVNRLCEYANSNYDHHYEMCEKCHGTGEVPNKLPPIKYPQCDHNQYRHINIDSVQCVDCNFIYKLNAQIKKKRRKQYHIEQEISTQFHMNGTNKQRCTQILSHYINLEEG